MVQGGKFSKNHTFILANLCKKSEMSKSTFNYVLSLIFVAFSQILDLNRIFICFTLVTIVWGGKLFFRASLHP